MRARSLAALLFVCLACSPDQPELPRLYPLPEAQLRDHKGEYFNIATLHGAVVVYDFIFTSCSGICPIMTSHMRELTTKIDKDAPVRFVSITVDPENDTPEVLREYAKRAGADDRWIFLTGSRHQILSLSIQGFKLAAGDPMSGGEALLHSSKFALVDKQGTVRGYYDGTDRATIPQIVGAIETLIEE